MRSFRQANPHYPQRRALPSWCEESLMPQESLGLWFRLVRWVRNRFYQPLGEERPEPRRDQVGEAAHRLADRYASLL